MLEKYKKQIDGITFVMAIVIPMVTLPQLFKIWGEQNAQGVSFITWFIYAINSVIWLLYGIVNKDKRIIILNTLFFLISSGIALGVVFYG